MYIIIKKYVELLIFEGWVYISSILPYVEFEDAIKGSANNGAPLYFIYSVFNLKRLKVSIHILYYGVNNAFFSFMNHANLIHYLYEK